MKFKTRMILLMLASLILLMGMPIVILIKETKEQNICREKYLGKQIAIDGDTLTIVKCNKFQVTLSNRTEVNKEIVDKLLIQK